MDYTGTARHACAENKRWSQVGQQSLANNENANDVVCEMAAALWGQNRMLANERAITAATETRQGWQQKHILLVFFNFVFEKAGPAACLFFEPVLVQKRGTLLRIYTRPRKKKAALGTTKTEPFSTTFFYLAIKFLY